MHRNLIALESVDPKERISGVYCICSLFSRHTNAHANDVDLRKQNTLRCIFHNNILHSYDERCENVNRGGSLAKYTKRKHSEIFCDLRKLAATFHPSGETLNNIIFPLIPYNSSLK
jgi:hypothetical protein